MLGRRGHFRCCEAQEFPTLPQHSRWENVTRDLPIMNDVLKAGAHHAGHLRPICRAERASAQRSHLVRGLWVHPAVACHLLALLGKDVLYARASEGSIGGRRTSVGVGPASAEISPALRGRRDPLQPASAVKDSTWASSLYGN